MYESKDKMVSHPDHYQSANGLEVIDCIEAFTAGLDGIEATDTGNIIKYACRWKKKNGIQDLEKIIWYTQHLIDYLKYIEYEKAIDDDKNDTKNIEEPWYIQYLTSSEPCKKDFERWFNDMLQKQGYVFSADLAGKTDMCAHAQNCKAFDKKEDK